MPTRRGRAGYEADVGGEPAEGAEETLGGGAQQGGETQGFGLNHGEDRDRSGSRGGSEADTGAGGTG